MGAVLFSAFSQQELNNLASILPLTLKLMRNPGASTVVFAGGDVSATDVALIRRLTSDEFQALCEINEHIQLGMREEDNELKIQHYTRCLQQAPWHYVAQKSAGVCYFLAGDSRLALQHLVRAAELAPDDREVLENLEHVQGFIGGRHDRESWQFWRRKR